MSQIKLITKSFVSAYKLVTTDYRLLSLSLIFSLSTFGGQQKSVAIVRFVIMLLSIGWVGAQVEMMRNDLEGKITSWKKFGQYIKTYIEKLIIPTLLEGIFFLMLFLNLNLSVTAWYLGRTDSLRSFMGLLKSSSNRIIYLDMMSPDNLDKFAQSSLYNYMIIHSFAIFGIIFSLLTLIIIAQMVTLKMPFLKAVFKSFNWVKDNLFFSVALLGLLIILQYLSWRYTNVFYPDLFSATKTNAILFFAAKFLRLILWSFSELTLQAWVLIYMMRAKND